MEVPDLQSQKPLRLKKLRLGNVKRLTNLRRLNLTLLKIKFKQHVSVLKKRRSRNKPRDTIKTIDLKEEPEVIYLPEAINRSPPSLDSIIRI
jgi:hypothetical protein